MRMDPAPRKTRKAWDEPGHAHFVTYSCLHRLPLLSRDRSRRWVIDALEQTRREQDVALWAYVIMPEHVHVVLYPRRPNSEMRQILSALKRPVSIAARDYLRGTRNTSWLSWLTVQYATRTVFRFWQPGGGFDHNIFREKTLRSVVDYLHANPVRRGLCNAATDWPWSSARRLEDTHDVILQMDEPF